jgi:hypothetical protein
MCGGLIERGDRIGFEPGKRWCSLCLNKKNDIDARKSQAQTLKRYCVE